MKLESKSHGRVIHLGVIVHVTFIIFLFIIYFTLLLLLLLLFKVTIKSWSDASFDETVDNDEWVFSKESAISTSHLAINSFSVVRFNPMGSNSVVSISFPLNCLMISSEYHCSKQRLRNDLAGLLTDKSIGWSWSVVLAGRRYCLSLKGQLLPV